MAAKRLLVAGKHQRDSVQPGVTQKWTWRVLSYKSFSLLNLLLLLACFTCDRFQEPWLVPLGRALRLLDLANQS